jgi:hypothetical protein
MIWATVERFHNSNDALLHLRIIAPRGSALGHNVPDAVVRLLSMSTDIAATGAAANRVQRRLTGRDRVPLPATIRSNSRILGAAKKSRGITGHYDVDYAPMEVAVIL